MANYIIYHCVYEDVCSDDYYGKHFTKTAEYFVTCSEEEVKAIVERLNEENHSYYSKEEPEDDYDKDFLDEDYYSYEAPEFLSAEELTAKLDAKFAPRCK